MPDSPEHLSREDFHHWLSEHSDEAVDELDVHYRSLGAWVAAYTAELRRMQAEEDGTGSIYEESEYLTEDED